MTTLTASLGGTLSLPELRRHPRREEDLSAQLCDPEAGLLDHEARALDLSLGGMSLRSTLPLRTGKTLRFSLALPRGRLVGEGRVRWSRALGYAHDCGLEITGLRSGSRRLLRRHLDPGSLDALAAGEALLKTAAAGAVLFSARELLRSDPALASTLVACLPHALLLGAVAAVVVASLRKA